MSNLFKNLKWFKSKVPSFATNNLDGFPPWITMRGYTAFPKNLLISKPSSSSTNPCVITLEYRALPLVATLVSKELWNHPWCWSVPSRYKSARQLRSFTLSDAAAREELCGNHHSLLLSPQTKTIRLAFRSNSFRTPLVFPFLYHFRPPKLSMEVCLHPWLSADKRLNNWGMCVIPSPASALAAAAADMPDDFLNLAAAAAAIVTATVGDRESRAWTIYMWGDREMMSGKWVLWNVKVDRMTGWSW